jgi:N-acylneuraminate cytidylyltransferase
VSKEVNPVVQARAAKLGVELVHSVEDKRGVVREWLAERQISADRAAYLGNDVNDLGPMGLVGWPVAVADAHRAVQQAARLVLTRPGGYGAVRELSDLIIEYRRRTGPALSGHSVGWQKSFGRPVEEDPLIRSDEGFAESVDAALPPLAPRI